MYIFLSIKKEFFQFFSIFCATGFSIVNMGCFLSKVIHSSQAKTLSLVFFGLITYLYWRFQNNCFYNIDEWYQVVITFNNCERDTTAHVFSFINPAIGLISLTYNSINVYLENVKVLASQGSDKKILVSECVKQFKIKKKDCEPKIEDYIFDKSGYIERSTGNISIGIMVVLLSGLFYLTLFLLTERVIKRV